MSKNNALTDQLVAHLDLEGDPFDDSVSIFFEGAQRQHNIETLKHMSSFGDMVLLLTGEKGAGKSTLLQRFAQESEDLNVVYVSAASIGGDKPGSIAKLIEAELDMPSVSGETTKQTFNRIVQQLQHAYDEDKVRGVIVIDDADLLPKKELQFYLNSFKSMSVDSGLVGVFGGLPSLVQKARLSCDIEEDEWLHQVQLKPLGVSECLEYLQLRLEIVGFNETLDLADSQLAHLAEVGKGLPGRINRMFSSVLLEPGSLKVEKSTSDNNLPKFVFITLALLLGGSFIFVAFQYGMFDLSEGTGRVDAVALNNSKPHGSKQLVQEQLAQELLAKELLAQEQRQARLAMLDKAISESISSNDVDNLAEGKAAELSSQDVAATGQSTVGAINSVQLLSNIDEKAAEQTKAVETVEKNKLVDIAEAAESENVTVNVQSKENKLQLTGSEVVEVKAIEKTAKAKALSAKQALISSEVKSVIKNKEKKPFYRPRQWVLSQPDEGYAAQVLGSHSEQTAINFAKKISKSSVEIYYLETLYKGKKWYVVFYGAFANKSAARTALKSAPEIVRKQKPWLRSFEAILKSYPK